MYITGRNSSFLNGYRRQRVLGMRASGGSLYLITTPRKVLLSSSSAPDSSKLGFSLLAAGFSLDLEWEEAQKLWVQEVSTAPSTRRDVVQLQEQLDRQLQQRQARETGLCPVRRELYTQCFDELIRQTTVSCAERGLLLLRVRDELQLTLSAYQALYESSVAFGVRKALKAEQGKAHLEKRIAELEEEKEELEKQVSEEKAKCEAIERQETERREIEEKKHSEEVLFLKRTNQQLKAQLECIIAAKN
uniref:Axonemal dynein light intermediate polypeptide 1 n=1 Tax=Serinus canaria TaxID=9135 RepID=A0A8C9NR57_SERCA